MHGESKTDLRRMFEKAGLIESGFAKMIKIDPAAAEELYLKLQEIGISRAMLFPGL